MNKRNILSITLHLALATILFYTSIIAQRLPSLLEQSQSLFKERKYDEALAVIESTFMKQNIEYNFRYGLYSTSSYLVMVYRRAGQLNRGVNTLHKAYLFDPNRYGLSDNLFDLSLETHNFHIAQEILDGKKTSASDPAHALSYARLFASQGLHDSCLAALGRYMEYEYADSRNRILTCREFIELHDDTTFQRLMTEPEDWLVHKRSRYKESMKSTPLLITRDSIVQIGEIYKRVNDYELMQQYKSQLEFSDQIIQGALPDHKEFIFNLLKSERKSTFFRLTIARFLVQLNDSIMTKRVVAETANDDYLRFPNELFSLAYTIAQNNPQVARPFLLQMLKQSEGGIFIPQHVISLNWLSMLMQAFGVAELQYLLELKGLCNDSNTIVASNALTLLAAFGEPDAIQIIMDRISHEHRIIVRDSLIRMIAEMHLPQSVTALKTLKVEAVSQGLQDTLESRLLKEVTPPEQFDSGMDTDAVRITTPNMKAIFLNNLLYTCGSDVSYMPKTILLSVNKSDIQTLRSIRSSIMRRMSDEAIYDYQAVSSIINWLQWQ